MGELRRLEAEIEYLKHVLSNNAPMSAGDKQDLKDKLFSLQAEYQRVYERRTTGILLAAMLVVLGIAGLFVLGLSVTVVYAR